MSKNNVKLGWTSIPMGGVSWKKSEEYLTGDWRSIKPVIDKEKCTSCLICWIYCPDSSISWDGKEVTIKYEKVDFLGVYIDFSLLKHKDYKLFHFKKLFLL